MIQSHERPANQVERNSKLYVRYAIREVTTDGSTVWQYKEKEFPIGTTEEAINNIVSKLAIAELADKEFEVGMVKAELERKAELEYYQKLRDEYNSLYKPEVREYTEEEKLAHDTETYIEIEQVEVVPEEGTEPVLDEEGNVVVEYKDVEVEKTRVIERPEGYIYPKVLIPATMTFEEYKNELKVVQEAVYETYAEYEARVQSEGQESVTEEYYNSDEFDKKVVSPEVTELVRPYVPVEVTDEMVQAKLESIPEYNEMLAKQKLEAIENIVIENNTVEYDAHTRARGDMSAIVNIANFKFAQAVVEVMPELQPVYEAVYKTQLDWKGKDNEVHTVQVESIAESLELAMKEYAKTIGAVK